MDLKNIAGGCLALLFAVLYPASALELVNITDTSCTDIGQACSDKSDDGCTSTIFTPEVDGQYTVKAIIDNCSSGPLLCTGCASEVYLYERDNPTPITCFHSGCCGEQSQFPITLTQGHQYVIYCCKIPCPNGADCEDCNTGCVARAKVY